MIIPTLLWRLMEHIKNYFNQFVDISDEELLLFTSKLTRMDVPKKSLILKQGKTENFLSFIEKGIVRFYIPDLDDGLTFSFSFEHSFFSAYDSFLTQRPCTYNRSEERRVGKECVCRLSS